MGRQSKAPKSENFGKGKVTPIQVAFMVDRYLSENNYTKTLSVFRTEASNLFSRTKGGQAPKGLLSLGVILDEYICLKEQKLMLDHEKCRVERLLQGMQEIMNAYNSVGSISPSMGPRNESLGGHPIYNTHTANSMHMLPSNTLDSTSFSTQIPSLPSTNKRKASRSVSDAFPTVKKSCPNFPAVGGTEIPLQETSINSNCETVHEFSVTQSSFHNNPQNRDSVQGSSVARSLFGRPPKPKTVSPCPKTPPRPLPSQADKSVSPSESSSLSHSSCSDAPQEIKTTNCHVISSKTVILSPYKNICISSPLKLTPRRSTRRDHVKGRLDFNDSDVPMSQEKPAAEISASANADETSDVFDIDIPNFDAFDVDFSLSELLVDIDLDSERMGLPFQQAFDPSLDFITGSDSELGYGILESNTASFEPLSSVTTTFLSEKDISRQGSESLISVKSITKCIQIVSPVKNRMSSSSEQVS